MRKLQKSVRLLLMAIPFVIPPCLGLVEEANGRAIGLNNALMAAFVLSLIILYAQGLMSAIGKRTRSDVLYGLLVFHIVRIPLFIAAWVAYIVVLLVVVFRFNGLEGIQ